MSQQNLSVAITRRAGRAVFRTVGRQTNYQVAASRVMANLVLLVVFVSCLSSCASGQDAADAAQMGKAAELLSEAAELHSDGKYDDAAKLAIKAAELAPNSFGVQQIAAETIYRSGFSEKSLAPFDAAVKLSPERAPDNWQRGLALATCGKFEAGAKQFETHHRVNPDDVENSAWYFLCVAKSKSVDEARKALIPSRGDPREPMMSILAMLDGQAEPGEVMKAALANTQPGSARKTAQLYADLYVGLYYDSLGESENAAKFLKRSLTYGRTGYMADTARVYYEERFKKADKAKRTADK